MIVVVELSYQMLFDLYISVVASECKSSHIATACQYTVYLYAQIGLDMRYGPIWPGLEGNKTSHTQEKESSHPNTLIS